MKKLPKRVVITFGVGVLTGFIAFAQARVESKKS